MSEWESVVSTQIEAFKYDDDGTLTVRFKGGSEYEYYAVPQDCVSGFRAAESKGTFLGKYIKSKYEFKKLEPAEIVEVKELPPVDISRLEKEALSMVDRANAITVTSLSEADAASAFVKDRKTTISVFNEFFSKIKKATWDAHQASLKTEKSIVDPNKQAIDIVTAKILAYQSEQARIIAAKREQERLRAEAEERTRREKEEADRKERQRIEDARIAKERAEIEAERKRLAEETAAKEAALRAVGMKEEAELARKRAEADAYIAKVMEDAAEVERQAQREREEREAAEALSAPVYTPVVPIVQEKIEGFTVAKIWKGEVVDMMKLLRAIVGTRPELIDCIQVNQKFIDQMAKAHKKADFGVPGVIGRPMDSGRSR